MKMNKKGSLDMLVGIIAIVSLVVLILIGIGYQILYAVTTGSETITIDEKWQKSVGDDGQKYLVSSTDGEVFEITDTFIKMRFDSSDLYAKLKHGQTCKIITQGWRFPFFSDYKNILEADC